MKYEFMCIVDNSTEIELKKLFANNREWAYRGGVCRKFPRRHTTLSGFMGKLYGSIMKLAKPRKAKAALSLYVA